MILLTVFTRMCIRSPELINLLTAGLYPFVVGGNQALPQDHKEDIPRTHAREVVWKDGLCKCKPAPGFPMSHLPSSRCGKSSTVLSAMLKQKLLSRVSASCESLVLWSPSSPLWAPVAAPLAWLSPPDKREFVNAQGEQGSRAREGASLFP